MHLRLIPSRQEMLNQLIRSNSNSLTDIIRFSDKMELRLVALSVMWKLSLFFTMPMAYAAYKAYSLFPYFSVFPFLMLTASCFCGYFLMIQKKDIGDAVEEYFKKIDSNKSLASAKVAANRNKQEFN